MFGKNQVVKLVDLSDDGSLLQVQEIFYTLQGEGPFSGHPAVFIRLAGCPLRCHWCDSSFDTGLKNVVPAAKVARKALQMWPFGESCTRTPLFVLTGGEPLRQNVAPLIKLLLAGSPEAVVQIETAGIVVHPDTLALLVSDDVAGQVCVVMSPKTPKVHPVLDAITGWWKYVVGHDDQLDEHGIPVVNTQTPGGVKTPLGGNGWRSGAIHLQNNHVYISPRDDHDPVKNELNRKTAAGICLKYGYTLSLQTHKIVGLE